MVDNTMPTVFEFSEDIANAVQPEPLPNGVYRGTITSAESKTSQAGNTYADVVIAISPAAFPADWTEGSMYPEGISLHYRRVTLEDTPQARFRLRRFVETAGLPKIGRRLDLTDWIGRDVKVETKVERGQDGLMYATAQSVLAA